MVDITVRKQYPDGYSHDALQVLNAMSLTDGKHLNIVGSMSLRSQIYAGDYDAYEIVRLKGDMSDTLRTLVSKFKGVIRKLQDLPYTYIGDIKSGSIESWRVLTEPYSYDDAQKKLKQLRADDIITEDEYYEAKKYIRPNLSRIEKLEALQAVRFHIIRWTADEVLKGYKILRDGRKFKLEDAFQTPTITKIDAVSWVQNSRFTDFSVIYEFHHNDTILNPGMKDIETSIRENIYILRQNGNYFKMAKRMFALAKYKGYTRELRILSEMFNGDLGRLYHVYGDLGTLESLIETTRSLPFSKIEFQIDQFKSRLSNVGLPDYLKDEDAIFSTLEKMIQLRKESYTREQLLSLIHKLKESLYVLLSKNAKLYLEEHELI